MSTIYRLRPSNDYTIEELTDNYLWFSKPSFFNDTEDSNIISFANKNASIHDLIERLFNGLEVIKNFLSNVGICCFTNKQPNSNSWRRFPNCKNGIMIEYNREELEEYFIQNYGLGDCFKKVDYRRTPTIFESTNQYNILWEESSNGNRLYKSFYNIITEVSDQNTL
ncbi:MAG: hypothetical protein N4A49_10805 [Marinifilaceae bacterium]|jgi:hypothetical protein|nr:hypothetical protein [Marinifilaceae bacterium]